MLVIGLIREGKIPSDNRVALTPAQCKWLQSNFSDIQIKVQSAPNRCFSDAEYQRAGIEVVEDLSACNLLLGIKEVLVGQLLAQKTYIFFSHTKKMQSHNQALFHAMMDKGNTLIDYVCLEHKDGQRIIGFGFFAGIVGAHNGIMAVGNLHNELPRDASRFFGEQLIKYILIDIRLGGSETIEKATILKDGQLTNPFQYLSEYAAH